MFKRPPKQLRAEVEWRETDDPEFPFESQIEGETWRLRLNDFPEEPMYTLFVGEDAIGDLDDWPKTWREAPRPAGDA